MNNVKYCVMCGKKPELQNVGSWKQWFIFSCPHCNFSPLKLGDARNTPKEAKRIWNRRCREYCHRNKNRMVIL